MTWTVSALATLSSAPIGTEVIVKTDTTNATYVAYFDMRAMQLGDVTRLRAYSTVSGANPGPTWQGTYANVGGGVATVVQSPFIASNTSMSISITQLSGTSENYDWKLLRQ